MDLFLPDLKDIKRAHKLIAPYIHKSPVLSSTLINKILGCKIYFKCENFQKVGAFKMRGAANAVFSLSKSEAEKGVATHSSGNFAQALALAAHLRGIKSIIVMPENSTKTKIDAVREYHGEIIFCKPNLAARESTLNDVVQRTGATFLHPYDNVNVICGQGTAALEFVEEIGSLDIIIAPVGGGGLISGTAISAKGLNPNIMVIGAEPAGADDAARSLAAGAIIPSLNPKTIADGLLTSLGVLNFPIIQKYVNEIINVQEDSIIYAMRLIWERMKIIIEPSSAVPVAAVLENIEKFSGKTIGIILSGGNVDFDNLPW